MPTKSRFVVLLAALLGLAALAPLAGAADLQRLMASPQACPGQDDPSSPVEEQEQAMRCLTDFARSRAGLRPLGQAAELNRSADEKSTDVLRCDSFSHFACGRDFTYWMQREGYIRRACFRAAENLAWGIGERASVRSIFQAWLASPGHRGNILGSYGELGIGLEVGTLAGRRQAHVWTQHFGSRCGTRAARVHRRIWVH